jgi:hypothetical protein
MKSARWSLLALLLFSVQSWSAGQQCYSYLFVSAAFVSSTTPDLDRPFPAGPYSTEQAAIDMAIDYCPTNRFCGLNVRNIHNPSLAGVDRDPQGVMNSVVIQFEFEQNFSPFAPGVSYATFYFRASPVDCLPDPCESLSGKSEVVGGMNTSSGSYCATVTYAAPSSGDPGSGPLPLPARCAVSLSGAKIFTNSGWVSQATYTGSSCSDPPPEDSLDVQADAPNCVSDKNGTTCVVKGEDSKNCTIINQEKICLASVPPGSCILTAGGGAVCDSNAPKPKDVNGNDVQPDQQIQSTDAQGNTQTSSYYSGSTISNSTGVAGKSNPDAKSVDQSSSTAEAVSACTGQNCNFQGRELEDVGDTEGIVGGFVTSVKASPLVSTISNIGGSWPDGQCPAGSVDLFGHSYSFGVWACDLWSSSIAPILSLVMYALWGFVGLKILMSA